ncbi:NAD(P)-binding domain-containing protein [Flavobacteriaceae bacterium]|nr:NAD(P)-binding domain-containing protein [Flavobacteriaceae bacterium]
MMRILLTSTSFQDTPGKHQDLLNAQNYDIVSHRGPLKEKKMLEIIENIDGLICGDDEITNEVIEKGLKSKLKIISKYGVGLDKIDLNSANKHNIKVTNCLGVNHNTVAEHVFALLLSHSRNINEQTNLIKQGKWIRTIGNEIHGKTIGIIGLGKIGKEVAKRSLSFGLNVLVFDKLIEEEVLKTYSFKQSSVEEILEKSHYISLHLPLNEGTKNIINKNNFKLAKKELVIINTARSGLISEDLIIDYIKHNKISAYLTDVLDEEPMINNHPFLQYDNIHITPHIGSRTYESVERQGLMAVNNLINNLK